MKRLSILLLLLLLAHPTTAALADAVDMAESSVTVDAEIEDAAALALGELDPAPDADYFAITDVTTSTVGADYYLLSIIGVDQDTDWNALDNGSWTGLVLVHDTGIAYEAAAAGTVTYTNWISATELSVDAQVTLDPSVYESTAGGSGGYYFPWQVGKMMMYGSRAVHEGVLGLDNDQAVDFVSGSTYGANAAPNMVYASKSGIITHICRDDGGQMGIIQEDIAYYHLKNSASYAVGQTLTRGQAIGQMMTGSFSYACGWADQQPTSYHIHFAFQPSGGYFQMENWILNTSSAEWIYGSDTVNTGEFLTALWNGTPIGPTPTPGGPTPTPAYDEPPVTTSPSLWDGFLNAIWRFFATFVAARLPTHESTNLATTIMSIVSILIRTTFILATSAFDFTIIVFVAGTIAVLQGLRWVIKIALFLLEFVKYFLKYLPFT